MANTLADAFDKHSLYEASVQNVAFEIDWVCQTFQSLRQRPLRVLREDFCGTGAAACEFVARDVGNVATAVDLDTQVIAWGQVHHASQLTPSQTQRLHWCCDDVNAVQSPEQDAVLAMNFSYWVFHQRAELKRYFEQAYRQLKSDGVFFLDAFGGYESFNEQEEVTQKEGFDYVWELARFNPITQQSTYQIHFRFEDGSSIESAFEYHWRHWHLPEIKELLHEVGFQKITIWMQGWDEENEEASDEFIAMDESEADPGWVAYITAEK